MHTRQSGAAHVNIFFFLIMLVLFLGALGFGYITLDKNNELERFVRDARAEVRAVENQRQIRNHYFEDIVAVVGESGAYAGRETFNYSDGTENLDGVAVPERVKAVMSEFARAAGLPATDGLANFFGHVKNKIDGYEDTIRTLRAQTTDQQGEIATLRQQVATITSEKQTDVNRLNSELRQKTDDYTSDLDQRDGTIRTANAEFTRLREEMSNEAAAHTSQVLDLRRHIETLQGRVDAAADKVKLINPPASPDGMVLESSQATGLAWVNIGRRDMLPLGTTFEIIKPRDGEVKAFGTVKSVQQDRAELRITGLKDRFDPVLPGDMIRNDLYSPEMKHNIFLMGRFSYPYTKPIVTRILQTLGNEVASELGPGVDLIILGQDTINEEGSGFIPLAETDEFKQAQFLRVEMAPLSKVRQYLRLSGEMTSAR